MPTAPCLVNWDGLKNLVYQKHLIETRASSFSGHSIEFQIKSHVQSQYDLNTFPLFPALNFLYIISSTLRYNSKQYIHTHKHINTHPCYLQNLHNENPTDVQVVSPHRGNDLHTTKSTEGLCRQSRHCRVPYGVRATTMGQGRAVWTATPSPARPSPS